MDNFDDLFVTENERKENSTFRTYDKDQWVIRKKKEKDMVFALLDEATQNAAKSPEAFLDYLSVQSQFEHYSVSNCLLIAKQYPNALKLCDVDTWNFQDAFVKRGETGIYILEAGNEYTKEDGSTGVRLNVKKVFDISQTTAEDKGVDAKSYDVRSMIKVIMAESPVNMKIVDDLEEGRDAKYVPEEHIIYFKRGLSGEDIFKAMAQNVIMAKAEEKGKSDVNTGFTAYCATYILCNRYGIDEKDFSFNDVAEHFDGKDAKQIRAELEACRMAANDMGQAISLSLEPHAKEEKHKDVGIR